MVAKRLIFIYSFNYLSIWLFIYLFIYLFVYLFIYLFIHLFIYLFIHLFDWREKVGWHFARTTSKTRASRTRNIFVKTSLTPKKKQ